MFKKYSEQEVAQHSRKTALVKPAFIMRIIMLLSAIVLLIGVSPAGANGIDCKNDGQNLVEINHNIAKEENTRDEDARQFFEQLLSDELIFRRADGSVVGKDGFIKNLEEKSAFTRTAEDIAVTRCGNRALVTLIVRTEQADGTPGRYRNVRVFFLVGNKWQLEVWYNYDLTSL